VALALFVSVLVFAQGKFTVNGRMKVEGSDLGAARAVVYKDGQKERTITTGLSKFSLDLALNANYIISFEKDGFVAKKISFNTRVPAEAISNGFTPFDFAVSLFKQYDDINMVVFNQPVGVIRYESGIGDFDYDTDYTKSIQSQLQQALVQVEKKQKEEAAAAEDQTVRAKVEEKEKARAEAEAQKQAAAQQTAQAKKDAEVKKQAEAEAEQARQETARKEQEIARREVERQAVEAQRVEEERKAQLRTAEALKPVPTTPPPAPTVKKEPPPPPRTQRNMLLAKASEVQDTRRTATPVTAEEASRVAAARLAAGDEDRPLVVVATTEIIRTEELIVEPSKVMTVVCLETAGVKTEYRKIIHKWGGTFYFKDGKTCSQQIYEREALSEQLAGASPRGKLD